MEKVSPDSEKRLLHGIARALIEQQRLGIARLTDPLIDYQPSDPLFAKPIYQASNQTEEVKPIGLSVGQAIADFLAAKRPLWTQKTYLARTVHLAYLSDFLGPDRTLAEVTSDDIRKFRKALTMLRANHGRQKHLTFHERLTENTGAQVKDKTASLIFEPVKSFLKWAKEEDGLLTVNPAADIKWQGVKGKKGAKLRRPFNPDELAILFGSTVFTGCQSQFRRFEPGSHVIKDDRYWIALLGFFTGARLGELIQLHLDDVVLDNGLPYIDLNENSKMGDPKHIKSSAGVRQIPLHPNVLELGFGDFIEKRRSWKHASKRVFSRIAFGTDGQASTQFSKLFGRMLDKVGLGDPSLTFHSFRHGMEDMLRNASLPQYTIDAIMGHSDGKVSSLYGNGPSLELKANAINQIVLPLDLPALLIPSS